MYSTGLRSSHWPARLREGEDALGIVYALTIIAGAIGELSYYILASAIEVALLAGVVYYAWTWPKETRPASTTGAGCLSNEI